MEVNLVVFNKDGRRRDVELPDGVFVIGRSTDCNLRIPIGEVSRRHAELKVSKGVVVIKDLGSSNGTYVNVERTEERELEPGDKISIGPVVLTVQIDGEPETIEPVRTDVGGSAGAGAPADDAGPDLDDFVADDDLLEALAGEEDEETRIPSDNDEP